MKRIIVLMTLLISLSSKSQMVVTNEVDATFDSTSYDTQGHILWGAYFATYFINMYPQYTNSINSVSQSGASWQLQFESNQPMWCSAHWANAQTRGLVPYDFMLANDNSAYNSNSVNQWGTNLFGAPALMWNGTAKTNEGFTFTVYRYALGANINAVSDGDNGAVSRNSGATNLNGSTGKPLMDLWHDNFTNGWNSDLTDQTGNDWFYALGHPTPKGNLAMALATVRGLGLETNVGSVTFDWSAVTVPSSNHFAAVSLSQSGNTFSCTLKADRMPMSWDTIPVISNNVCQTVFASMPAYGNILQWTIQFTNLPNGTYNAYLDGVLWDTATASQWAAGRNMATNFAEVSLNLQRRQTLYDVCDKYGVDHTTRLNTHTAGENGVNGPDQINYQSVAFGAWPATHGPALVTALATQTTSLRGYDITARTHAQQTNHTFSLSLATYYPAPFRR